MSSRSSSFSRRALPAIGLGLALAAAWVLWPVGGGLWAAAPASGRQGAVSETTEVVAVQVPVQVVRNGEPVRGLTAADFEVYDGRRKQTVTGFEVLDLAQGQGGPAMASIAPALRRHFLLLFDLSNSEPKSIVKARQMVREMLPALNPSDLVAVASYSSASGPRLLLGFTSDRRQVSQAIDNLGLPQLVDRNPDPLQLIAAEPDRGAKAGPQVTENNQDLARMSERANRQQQQAVVGALARSFTDLARLLAGIHGRKQVIYLSEGFDTSLLQGSESVADQAQMAEMTVQGRGYLTDSDQRYGDTRNANVLEKMMEEFRRSDCIIQSIDIGGARSQTPQSAGGVTALPVTRASGQASQQGEAPVRRSGEGALFAMAHDTGGELYHNFNDLGVAMGQLLKKTSVTYVLTFQPDEVKHDGSFHKLRVELKGQAGKGAQVFFRPGYYVPKPYSQQTQKEKILAAADQVVGGSDSGAVRTALLVAPFRQAASALQAPPPAGAGAVPAAGNAGGTSNASSGGSTSRQAASDKAYVPVVIEADGPTLLEGSAGAALPAEIYAYAIDSAGAIQDFFSQSLRLDLAKAGPALRRSGLKFFGHLDLPPGDYNVRVLVRNGATGAYGLRSQPLVVPAFGEPAAVLLQPFFPEVPGRWVLVREVPRKQEKESPPYPFVIQEKAYIPASLPVLAAGQEAVLALVGYHLPAGAFQARARLLAADGKDLGEGELKIGRRESPDAEGEDRLSATFRPPRNFEPGEYQLVIVLTDAQGGAHQSAARFVVPAPAPASPAPPAVGTPG